MQVIILGLCLLAAMYFILKVKGSKIFSVCIALFGGAMIFLSIFPEYTVTPHLIFAVIAFFSGSFALLTSYKLELDMPICIIGWILGGIALVTVLSVFFIGVGPANPLDVLGKGGAERLIIYPVVIYLTALGGYLAAKIQN